MMVSFNMMCNMTLVSMFFDVVLVTISLGFILLVHWAQVHGSHHRLQLLHLLPVVVVEHDDPEVWVGLPGWHIGSLLVWLWWECAVSNLVGLGSVISPRCGTEAPEASIVLVLGRSTPCHGSDNWSSGS